MRHQSAPKPCPNTPVRKTVLVNLHALPAKRRPVIQVWCSDQGMQLESNDLLYVIHVI